MRAKSIKQLVRAQGLLRALELAELTALELRLGEARKDFERMLANASGDNPDVDPEIVRLLSSPGRSLANIENLGRAVARQGHEAASAGQLERRLKRLLDLRRDAEQRELDARENAETIERLMAKTAQQGGAS